ncbi:RNA-binding protein Cwf29 [Schizosaccharomyces japonicus yFS275]|uniref:RNA-binding protein Cwf29 n=1 Tax=Schizosaccharomyces japonicus (strain yFS275 / FY16936) TaxID=402676 RepID=B6JVA6_SCHJY|nr:RNA-binding protein Cwf29 [Schizosaccharomyces japonicus yFS275]EEB05307.1 RNA-binding protein Cwf29 [Schizosaccharomyces japonicus yFS275]
MNTIREIERLNEKELGKSLSASWHQDYKDSAYIYIGNLDKSLNEHDVVRIFSEFGTPVDIHLVRDKETKESRGFAFLKYADQRSTILAVDNMTNVKLHDRLVRVDHVANYRVPENMEPLEGDPLGLAKSEGPDETQSPKSSNRGGERTARDKPVSAEDFEKEMMDPMHEYLKSRSQEKEGEREDRKRSHRHRHHHRTERTHRHARSSEAERHSRGHVSREHSSRNRPPAANDSV